MKILPQRISSKITLGIVAVLLMLSFFLKESASGERGVHVSLAPETLFSIGNFPVTNGLFWAVFLSVVLIAGAVKLRTSLKEIPGGFQNVIEATIEGFFNFTNGITGSEGRTKKIFPLTFTLFLFILFANLFTFLPGANAVSFHSEPLFRAIATDYNLVLFLTLTTVLLSQIIAVSINGMRGYVKKFINFSSPLNFIIGIMDLVGEFSKVLSLSFRLFGNIFAGEVLLAVMLFLLPHFAPLPFMLIGLLSAVIQAFVFSLLTTVFFAMAWEKSSH